MLFNFASLVAILYLNVFGTLALPVVEPRADGIDQTTYNNMERFARFSSAAYQLICPRPLGTTLVKSIDRGGTQGFVTRDDARQEIVVSFRGTFSIGDAIVDLQVAMTDLNTPGVTGVGSARVHTGFNFAYNAVANDVVTAVRGQLSSRPSYTVVVTGHSLGGAVASLGALSLKSAFPSANVKLYTYANRESGTPLLPAWLRAALVLVTFTELCTHTTESRLSSSRLLGIGTLLLSTGSSGTRPGQPTLGCVQVVTTHPAATRFLPLSSTLLISSTLTNRWRLTLFFAFKRKGQEGYMAMRRDHNLNAGV